MKKDFLSLLDHSRGELEELLVAAARLKADLRAGKNRQPLSGKTLSMIFEKPSLRTRVTFETGIKQLGGGAVYLAPNDIQLGERESVADIARNLSRWVDIIMARTYSHDAMLELARFSTIPVINGLSDLNHPCQVVADCQTLLEHRPRLDDLVVTFVGDGNNVVTSWINAASRLGFEFRLACPPGYEPPAEVLAAARASGVGAVEILHDPNAAAEGADALYTDVWTSMGQEEEAERRKRDFADYQIDAALLTHAKPDALVMHCLPAHRGEEITAEVVDGPQSVVLEQAENRLHAQKAIMLYVAQTQG